MNLVAQSRPAKIFDPHEHKFRFFEKKNSIPKVLASSGIMGTNLEARFLSRSKAVNILTKIVEDISLLPVDSIKVSKISFGGVFNRLAKDDLSGIKPPNFNLLSFKYFISSEFSLGL